MVKILRAPSLTSKQTPKGSTANPKAGSWHDPSQLTRGQIKTRISVQRRFVNDPNNPIWYPEQMLFSANANPRFNPGRGVSSATTLDGTPQPPAGFNSGHQKVIRQTNQMKTGGKTLKKRS